MKTNFIDGFPSLYNNNSATSTFDDIFPTKNDFLTEYRNSDLNDANITDETLSLIYVELYATYGDHYYTATNDVRNVLKTFSIIKNEGLIFQKKLEIQNSLLNLNLNEITEEATVISNYAENPGDEGVITTDAYSGEDFLKYVNNQNVSKTKREKFKHTKNNCTL
jgi:hypothetical protein